MTRFARFGGRNKGRVQDASQWDELKNPVVTDQKPPESSNISDEHVPKPSGNSVLNGVRKGTKFKPAKLPDKLENKFGKKCLEKTSHRDCFNCHQPGHNMSNCPKAKIVCHHCNQLGHKSFQCPEKTSTNSGADKHNEGLIDKDSKIIWTKAKRSEHRRLKRQQEMQTKKLCFNCREPGHQLSECPEVKKDVEQGTGICFKCGSTEHAVNRCTVKLAPGEYPYAKCFVCGEIGHLSRACPDNPRGLYPNGGCCTECGSVEHLRRDCPVFQKKQGISSLTLGRIGNESSVDSEVFPVKPPKKRTMPGGPKLVKF